MNREDRYLVIKRTDAACLNAQEQAQLERLCEKVALHRLHGGKPVLHCVVVEQDWPEYESTWNAIADRVDGAPPAARPALVPVPKATSSASLRAQAFDQVAAALLTPGASPTATAFSKVSELLATGEGGFDSLHESGGAAEGPADQYYLQDSRSYVGNDVLWWGLGGNGYVTDVRKAQCYSKDDAVAMHRARSTDIPWPKAYIEDKTRPAVDMQYIKQADALAGTGIVLLKPEKMGKVPMRCVGCGRLMSDSQVWSGACSHCGADSRP